MRFAVVVLALLLVLVTGASAWLALQSCGLRIPLIGWVLASCEPDARLQTRRERDRIDGQNSDLSRRIAYLQARLGGLACAASLPPPVPETPSGLAPDAFDARDISVMEGCWQLSSDYAVREINTNLVTRFKYWRICFDENGNGTEIMRSTDGVVCEGTLSGQIPGNGKLSMREPANLDCDNNTSIFRRDITCTLDNDGNAQCDTYQPETNGRSAATLRRARR